MLFYQGGVLVPKKTYRDAGIFDVKTRVVDDTARILTYATAHGTKEFTKKLGKAPELFGRLH
ncbi:hypothetical protein [Aureimonas glaciei]|nr:hypothetical protein [Aureimonas glaciei]